MRRTLLLALALCTLAVTACGSKNASKKNNGTAATSTADAAIAQLQATIVALQQQLAQAQATPSSVPATAVSGAATPAATVAIVPTRSSTVVVAASTAAGDPAPRAPASVGPSRSATAARGAAAGKQQLTVGAMGYAQDGQAIGWAFQLTNPNAGQLITFMPFQLAYYDAAGNVLNTDEGFLDGIWPNQMLVVAGQSYLQNKTDKVARFTVQIAGGDFQSSQDNDPLSTAKPLYRPDAYFPTVTGIVSNASAADVQSADVYAVGYDAAGKIVGGGETVLQIVPAGGTSAASVSVTFSSPPAKVELYATFNPTN